MRNCGNAILCGVFSGWRYNKLVKSLEGKMIRLRVVMKDADLFAFRFVD